MSRFRTGAPARALALTLTTGAGLAASTAAAGAASATGQHAPAKHHTVAKHQATHRRTVHHSAIPARFVQPLAKLRACESGGNYRTNTGNGYYGAYQFDAGTWHGLGLKGLPSDNSPLAQDEAVLKVHAARGWSPWPTCAAAAGLV